jgi:hypothetical protein
MFIVEPPVIRLDQIWTVHSALFPEDGSSEDAHHREQ